MGKNFKTSAAAAFITGIAKPEAAPEPPPSPAPISKGTPAPASAPTPLAVAASEPAPSPAPISKGTPAPASAPTPLAVAAPEPAPSSAPMAVTTAPVAPSETAPEAPLQIDGKEVVIIYRRPRKGDKVERRTRQAHLLMLPSLYKESQKFAKANGTSFNALVEDALIAYLEQHKEH